MQNSNDPFVPHGSYAISNACGYFVQLSEDGEQARLAWWLSSQSRWEISDWLDIETDYPVNELSGDLDIDEPQSVIDPDGFDIPLDQVMRVEMNCLPTPENA